MKLVLFNGGLGNQLFQYIFAKHVELVGKEPVILEDSYFYLTEGQRFLEKGSKTPTVHNGNELAKVFGLKPRLLSECFSADIWQEMIMNCKNGYSIPDQLRASGIDLFTVQEAGDTQVSGNMVRVPVNQYTPEISITTGDVFYNGYWICKGWFRAIEQEILQELKFPPLNLDNAKHGKIIQEKISVGIHIRRGDFLKIGWALPPEYYKNNILAVEEKLSNEEHVYFVFSDDIDWCKKNTNALGLNLPTNPITFVEGNFDKVNNYVDMQLMTMCKHLIIANSSFSYLASLMNRNISLNGGLIVDPTNRDH